MKYAWQDIGMHFLDAMNLAGRSVIDVGCGDGWAALAMQERGADVTALDILPESHRKLAEIHAADIVYTRTFSGQYNLAWCHHTLEHIRDPIAFLQNVRAVASQLWCIVPRMDGDGFAKDHINRYNMPVLVEHLRRAGWDIEHGSYTTYPARSGLCAVVRPFASFDPELPYDQDGANWSPYPLPMDLMNTKGENTMMPAFDSWNWPPL
jgi:SAM-dependent methyltransferase